MGICIDYRVIAESEEKVNEIIEKVKESFKALSEKVNVEIKEVEGKGDIKIYGISNMQLKYLSKNISELTVVNKRPSLKLLLKEEAKGKMVVEVTGGKKEFSYWLKVFGEKMTVTWYPLPFTRDIISERGKYEYKGIIIRTETTEDIAFVFVKVDNNLWLAKQSVKTQPFEDYQFSQNAFIHAWLCALLHEVQDQGLGKVVVEDEAEYYETGEIKRMLENFGATLDVINIIAKTLTRGD